MKLRIATIDDYIELVEMYKALLNTVYHGMKVGKDIFIHREVQNWFNLNRDVVICEKDDGTTTGFTLAYKTDGGVVESYYFGDIAYVKPQYRKGRSAYLMYNNVVNYAKQQGLPIIAKAYIGDDDISKNASMQGKFGKPVFMEFYTEGATNGFK